MRLVFVPEHVNPDGTLKNTAISKQDLRRVDPSAVPERGLSVFRRGHTNPARIQEKAAALQAGNPENRQQVRRFEIAALGLRQITDQEGDQAVCVVDRAEEDDPSHAEGWGSKKRGDGSLAAIRDKIVRALNEAA